MALVASERVRVTGAEKERSVGEIFTSLEGGSGARRGGLEKDISLKCARSTGKTLLVPAGLDSSSSVRSGRISRAFALKRVESEDALSSCCKLSGQKIS